MTIARWGLVPLIISALVLAWGVWLLPCGPIQWGGIAVASALWLFVLAFFRNPRRTPLGTSRALIAPADGIVWDITEVDEPAFIGGRALRIGIFLSVFDVHVNRSPCAGTIAYAHYRPGKWLDVRHPDCDHENEANTIGIEVDPAVAPDLRILVRQLSGLIARRIVCTHGVGSRLAKGELYGMIRFGSRTELWIPAGPRHRVMVSKGQRVRCGETAMVEFVP
jgi:phosphatidylserine decarboxylase